MSKAGKKKQRSHLSTMALAYFFNEYYIADEVDLECFFSAGR